MRYLLVLLCLCFAGCVSVPREEVEKGLASSVDFSSSVGKAVETGAFQRGEWPQEKWWEMFHDVQLSRFIETALKESPTIQKVQARVDRARQVAKEKLSFLFPTVSASLQDNWLYLSKNGFFRSFAPDIPARVNDIQGTLNLNWEVDFFGKNRHLYQAAVGMKRADMAEAAAVALFLSTAVAKTYFSLQANLAKEVLLKETIEKRGSLLQLHEARRHHGLDNEPRLLETQQDLFAMQNALIRLKEAIALDQHLLRMLMGQGPEEEALPVVQFAPYSERVPLPSLLQFDFLARRPDIMAQIWKIEAAASQVGAAKANFYPNVNLAALLGLESIHFSNFLSKQSLMGLVNPAINLPIFNAGRIKARYREKKAEFEEAIAAYHETLLLAAREVVDQLSSLRLIKEQIEIQKRTVENLQARFALALSRYVEKISPYMEVLKSEENLIVSQTELIHLEEREKQSVTLLMKALGGGYHSDYFVKEEG